MVQTVTAKLYNATGTYLSELPAFQQVQIQEQLNTENAWQMQYDLNGIGASQLIADEDRQVAILLDGTEVFRGVIEEDSWDEVTSESAWVQLAGRGMAGMLEFAKVYPSGGVGHKPATHTFTNATPGTIFRTLFLEAQARGCLPGWTLDFNGTTDSSSNTWTKLISITYQAGVSLLDIIKSFGSSNQADFRVTGTTIHMYNPKTTLGQTPNITFRRGIDIMSSPRSRSRRSLQTVSLVQGDNDITVERVDSIGVSTRGRKEGFTSQGGITDTGTLNGVGDNILSVYSPARLSKTHTLSFDGNTGAHPVPWIDYLPGYYLKTDLSGNGTETYRLVALNLSLTNTGSMSGEVTLNDVFQEREVLLDQAVSNLTSGSYTTTPAGPSTGTPLPSDGTIPGIPSLITPFVNQTYLDSNGLSRSRVIVTWNAPLNTDGSIIVDADHYEIRYRLNTSTFYPQTWAALASTPWNALNTWAQPFTSTGPDWQVAYVGSSDTSYTIQELATGVGYEIQIRLVDQSANASDWSSIVQFVTNSDNIAPSTPDAPKVAASRIAIQVTHDLGRATGGNFNLEQDLHHLEVHASSSATFVASPSTLLGKLPATGGMIQAQVPAVGTFQVESTAALWVVVVAVDTSGNRSNQSAAATSTALLIDDAHISSLTVSKVTAGTISADFLVGARIKTANSGARVELSPSGLLAYNSAGVQTVSISSADGSATMIGQFSSGVSSDRVVVNPAGGPYPEIRFYPTTGSNYTTLYSRGDEFPTEATFHIDSGIDQTNTYTAHHMHAAGTIWSWINNQTTGHYGGGYFQMTNTSVILQYTTSSDGSSTGGEFFADANTMNVTAGATGANQSSLSLDSSSRHTSMQGRWYNFVDQGPTAAVWAMSQVIGAFSASSWSYGPTMTNSMAVIGSTYNTSGNAPGTVTASNSTGFTWSTTVATNSTSRAFIWAIGY